MHVALLRSIMKLQRALGILAWTIMLRRKTNCVILTNCKNGGTCTYALNRYTCQCADGYNGDNCEIGRSETHIGEALRTSTFVINHDIKASILETCSSVCLVENWLCLFNIQLHVIHILTIFLIPSHEKTFIHIWLLGKTIYN